MARIQGREVYEKLHGKYDPELVSILVSIAERQQVQHQQMMAVAEAVNKLMDQFQQVVIASGNAAKVGQMMMKRLGFQDAKSMVESFSEQDDDSGPTTPR